MPGLAYYYVFVIFIVKHGASAQFDPNSVPHVNLKSAAALTPDQVTHLTRSVLKSVLPNNVQQVLQQGDEQREALLNKYLTFVRSPRCAEDVKLIAELLASALIKNATVPPWLLHMIDASGKIPSGLLRGNVQSVGYFSQCLELRADEYDFRGSYCSATLMPWQWAFPANGTGEASTTRPGELEVRRWDEYLNSTEGAALDVEAFMAMMKHEGFPMVPTLGVCFPSSCDKEDVQALLSQMISAASERSLFPIVQGCQTDKAKNFNAGDYVMIGVLGCIGVLCFIGTSYDLWTRKNRELSRENSTTQNILLAFSIPANARKILSTDIGDRSLGCINGLRFLSMAWVILAHTFVMSGYQINANFVDFYLLHTWGLPIMAFINSSVSVDNFFVMSGLLVSYNLLNEFEKNKESFKEFARTKLCGVYVQRYLRLTPTMLILLGFWTTLYVRLSASPTWYQLQEEAEVCKEKWWHNALYLNNILDTGIGDKMCFDDTWYLANEMMFFWLAPFIVYPLWRFPHRGLLVLVLLMSFNISTLFYLHDAYKIIPVGIPGAVEVDHNTKIYRKPWTRIGTYLVGIFAGYLLHRAKKRPQTLRPSKYVTFVGWSLSTLTALVVIFGPYELFKPEHVYEAHHSVFALLYGAFHRFAWGCAIAWTIFACVKGHGGWVNRVLCWKPFVPLSRLTYSAYMTSFHVQNLYHSSLMLPIVFTPFVAMHNFCAHLVLTMLVSFVVAVTIESPFLQLTKLAVR